MHINIVNLRKNLQYLEQYIQLRNTYAHALLSKNITYETSQKWIQDDLICVLLALEEQTLLGVAILYLAKDNEVSIFTKEHNKGIGTLLLQKLEQHALRKGLHSLHSWIADTNIASASLFKKQRYIQKKQTIKYHNNIKYAGYIFQKELLS